MESSEKDMEQNRIQTNTPGVEGVTATAVSGISYPPGNPPLPVGYGYNIPVKKEMDAEEREKRLKHFSYFSIASILYAVFYTVCLYRNPSGVTYPFFIGGTLFYFLLYLKKYGVSAKKDSVYYIAAMMLLGISSFLTDDGKILFLNKTGIFILMMSFVVHSLCQDGEFNVSAWLGAIGRTVFGTVGAVGRPFSDFSIYRKHRKESRGLKEGKGRYIFYGLLICVPLVFIILLLLASADKVFDRFIDKILESISIPEHLAGVCFTLVFAFFASYCLFSHLSAVKDPEKPKNGRTGEPVLAITVTAVLSVIYVVFSGIQIFYLFAGGGEIPYGYTYAEYAREGFFQLLFVCLINLTLVLICLERFRESRLLKLLLTLISVCTYVMIASSAMRMILYIKYYYLTFLRIFVLWALCVIFLWMTGVLVSIYKESFPVFPYSLAVISVLYICLSFARPDYIVARVNTSALFTGKQSAFFERNAGYGDMRYLESLSADAAPVLLTVDDPDLKENLAALQEAGNDDWWYSGYMERMKARTEDKGLRGFNVSRYRARTLLERFQGEIQTKIQTEEANSLNSRPDSRLQLIVQN